MAIPKKIRQQVYDKCGGHCAYCGKEIAYKDMQVDHVVPKRRDCFIGHYFANTARWQAYERLLQLRRAYILEQLKKTEIK